MYAEERFDPLFQPPETVEDEEAAEEDRFTSSFGKEFGRLSSDTITNLTSSLTGPEAPPAIGRSGKRQERGKASSGLIGENLRMGEDVRDRSDVQRAWLPGGDAALEMRLENRVPVLDPSSVENTTLPGIG